jgi:hypothetical protein
MSDIELADLLEDRESLWREFSMQRESSIIKNFLNIVYMFSTRVVNNDFSGLNSSTKQSHPFFRLSFTSISIFFLEI